MATLGEMKADIADDIDDTEGEYADQIAKAIEGAIRWCERDQYYFNDNLGTRRLPVLTGDDAVNPWTSDAYDMIKARAKYILAKNTLKDVAVAQEALNDYHEQDKQLREETHLRRSTGFVRPTWF